MKQSAQDPSAGLPGRDGAMRAAGGWGLSPDQASCSGLGLGSLPTTGSPVPARALQQGQHPESHACARGAPCQQRSLTGG